MMTTDSAPDFLFIDTVLLAYRLGYVQNDEQKLALLAAARAAKDSFSFLTALENFGIGRRTGLYRHAGEILSATAFYRAKYPGLLGLPHGNEPPAAFLGNQQVLSLVEPVLTTRQQTLFYDTYWKFVRQHDGHVMESGRDPVIGIYATAPRDNASTLPRFQDWLLRHIHHSTLQIRSRFEAFPADIVLAILRRSFL